MAENPLLKLGQLQKVVQQINIRQQYQDAKEKMLNEKENLLRQGLVPNTGPQTMQANLQSSLDPTMVPGNVGDINKVLWPYYFSTDYLLVNPAETVKNGFTVTQEAAFIWMAYTKVVSIHTAGPEVNTYINPDDVSGAGLAPGLSFTIRDSQSARDYQNQPINLDSVGNPRWPTTLPRPLLILPNSNVEISFTNSHASNIYVPFLTAFGYRIRIEDAKNLLGTVFT